MQLGLDTSVYMFSYRDQLFEMIHIGMSIVYSVFAGEFCNNNVL